MPDLEQSAYNTTAKYQTRSCTATFTHPSTPGNLIIVIAAAAGTLPKELTISSGYTLITAQGQRDIQMSVWYRVAAPATTSVTVTTPHDNKSLQVRMLEYSGMSQGSNVLDRVAVLNSGWESGSTIAYTGSTSTTQQAEELVLACVTNQYASTTQYGFYGGLVRLYDTTSPQNWSGGSNVDWERSRITIHQRTTTQTGSFFLAGALSAARRWSAIVMTFRSGASGPARFTSLNRPGVGTGGIGYLTVFGPLTSDDPATPGMQPVVAGMGVQARIGPFQHQYRLGGWQGLLIGAGTRYRVESIDGLSGWEVRTSDDDLPRGDGALRGIDLQSARQALFRVNTDGTPAEVEQAMDVLYRSLIPQRDQDWELIWRDPDQPLQLARGRPVNLVRELDWQQTIFATQEFVLRFADPRHYSAFIRTVHVENTAAGAAEIPIGVINEGNSFAYPLIRINGPASGAPLSRVQLTNATIDAAFVVEAQVPTGSTLIGDMEARAIGAPRSVVTIDGQAKYGAWVQPRETFRLAPGDNALVLTTVPEGRPVEAVITYRDTWSG